MIRDIVKEIIDYVEKIDKKLEDIVERKSLKLYATPFLQDFYLELKDSYIDFKSKVPKIFINPYDVYLVNFLGTPLIRGIRTKFSGEILAKKMVEISKLQLQKMKGHIYKRYPGTLITFGKIQEIRDRNPWSILLRYFSNMYAKPFIYLRDTRRYGKVWHENYLLPNVTSFLSIGLLDGSTYYLMPFNMILMLEPANMGEITKEVLGVKLEGKQLKGYTLGINLTTQTVKYLGPFPVFIPEIELIENSLLNDIQNPLIGYFQGIAIFDSRLSISNDIKKENCELVVFSTVPFSLELYVLAKFGNSHIVNTYSRRVSEYIIKFDLSRISIDTQTVNKIFNEVNNAIIRFTQKMKSKGYSKINNVLYAEKLLENILFSKKVINKTNKELWSYHPAFLFYCDLLNWDPEIILQKLNSLDSSFDVNLIHQLRYLAGYLELYRFSQEVQEIERKIASKYGLWYSI